MAARFFVGWMKPIFAGGPELIWKPPADVYRTRKGWLIKFELAGVRPEDVELAVSGPRLTVRGIRRDWAMEEDCRCYLMEISYSHFERTLTLPCDLDRATISAEHRHGFLLVRIQMESESNG